MPRVLVNLCYLVPLALWTGAATGLTFLSTPVIFEVLDRDTASRLVSHIFPGYFQAGIIAVALSLIAALLGVRAVPGRKRVLWAIPAALGLMLALMLYSGLVLQPQVAAIQAQIPSFLTDTLSPARLEFRRLHSISSILNVVTMLLAAATWVLTALDPRLLTSGAARSSAMPLPASSQERNEPVASRL